MPASVNLFEKNLSRNARKQRKRRRQQLHSAGKEAQFRLCVTRIEVIGTFEELLRLHNLRHANKGGSESFQSDKYRRFHLAVMEKALENNELRLLRLIVDDKIIGIEYAFHCKDILSFFQTGFDPAFQQFSPGHLLMMETIDRAIADGAESIDLLKGDYEYKQSYAKKIKTTIDLDLWRSPLIALIARVARSFRNIGSNERHADTSSRHLAPSDLTTR